MSVFTSINQTELADFLQNYRIGTLAAFEGIGAGIENTNYFVDINSTHGKHRYVLTLFETIAAQELPYVLNLMAFLAEREFPCAHPIADREGAYLRTLKGKPAVLVEALEGHDLTRPDQPACEQIGALLARLHLLAQDYPAHRENPRGSLWHRQIQARVQTKLSNTDRDLLDDEMRFQTAHAAATVPQGVIHADLFCDNALFSGNRISGIIDFYYACNAPLLYDLAVTVNDWCRSSEGLHGEYTRAILTTYHRVRPLTAKERSFWPVLLRAGALRFWLSRLHDLHFPRPGELTHCKDPDVFKQLLLQHRRQHKQRMELWP